ncbi:MAG: ccmG [Acidimicrobiales bacterium]|nr:ccmG [Acidimicrobiales bacterium]
MSNDLEQRFEREFAMIADGTPWSAGSTADVVRRVRRRRRRRHALRGATMVVVLATVASVAYIRSSPAAPLSTTTTIVVPRGKQISIVEGADPPRAVMTEPGSARRVIVAGGQSIDLAVHADISNGVLVRSGCVEIDMTGICRDASADPSVPAIPLVGGSDSLVFWSAIPAGTAFVQLHAGSTTLWQIPIDGIAAFPGVEWHSLDEIVAYDASGEEIGRADLTQLVSFGAVEVTADGHTSTHDYYFSTNSRLASAPVDERWTALSDAQQQRQRRIAETLMTNCIGDRFVTSSDWTSCMDSSNRLLREAFLATTPADGQTTVGRRMPVVTGKDTRGYSEDLDQMIGRWLVLSFTSSTCGPCGAQDAALKTFYEQQSALSDPPMHAAIALDTDAAVAKAFYENHGSWPTIIDADGSIASSFGITQIPEVWIIDPAGVVRLRLVSPVTADQLAMHLDELRHS